MKFFLVTSLFILVTSEEAEKSKDVGPLDLFNYAMFKDAPKLLPKLLPKLRAQPSTFAFNGNRPGNSVDTHACHTIRSSVPVDLTFITRYGHYTKYTHAYGIPIISTHGVSDVGLKRACYVVRFLLADRKILRESLYKNYGRIGIMAENEGTTSIPEHRHLGRWWDSRARGLGGTLTIPISTGGEENLLCRRSDRYSREDIFLHEFSHGIQEVAIRGGGIPGYFGRLQRAYNSAKYRGLWRSTYSMSTIQEYFAEGVQSYFEVNDYAATPNGVHGPVNTRSKLRTYDPTLYRLVREVFPCGNVIHDRCKKGNPGSFRMNCDGSKPAVTKRPTTSTESPPITDCEDENKNCYSWARRGECIKNKSYMLKKCKKSCNVCRTSNCIDNHQHCASWRNYCQTQKYRKFMTQKCKKTCSVC